MLVPSSPHNVLKPNILYRLLCPFPFFRTCDLFGSGFESSFVGQIFLYLGPIFEELPDGVTRVNNLAKLPTGYCYLLFLGPGGEQMFTYNYSCVSPVGLLSVFEEISNGAI